MKKKGLTVVEVAVIASLTLILGLFLMGISAGLFFNTTLDLTEETDRNIQLLRGILFIENVKYSEINGEEYAYLYLRNIAKQYIDLTVVRVELIISRNNTLYDSIPDTPTGFGNLTKLKTGEKKIIESPICPSCMKGEVLIYRVWYISSDMYNVENPLMSINDMLYVEAKIAKPIGAEMSLKCPLPRDNWVIVDYVDPVTGAMFGRISSLDPVISIRPSLASTQANDVSFTITVREIEGAGSGSGSATLNIPTIRLERIRGVYGGLQTPMKIFVYSDWNIIQKEWVLGGIPEKIHVSSVFLQWSRVDRTLEGIMLELGYGEVGSYTVTIILKDCEQDVIQTFSLPISVDKINEFEVKFIPVSTQIRIDQVYFVETIVV
ncbi:MAG: hypothetical protein N2380_10635 [bacterium]|nr:hypothetical protein [bacterium]